MSEINKVEIGKRVEKLRVSMNMSKERFAKNIGMVGQNLGAIEHGKAGLSIDKLYKICEFTKTSSDYILFGSDRDMLKDDVASVLDGYSEKDIQLAFEMLKILLNHYKND